MNPGRLCALVLAVLMAAGLLTTPAQAAEEPDFRVTIESITPPRLTGKFVRVSGTVTNNGSGTWTGLQIYLAVPQQPFTNRAQMAEALAGEAPYTGERIVDLRYIDQLPDLAEGASATYSVRIPTDQLGQLTGVYPLGVHLLATDPDGQRGANAAARTATFLPLFTGKINAPVTVVWPFLLQEQRKPDNTYPDQLAERLAPNGQLRNLLDAARSTPSSASTLLVDPALLDAAADIADGRHGSFKQSERVAAREFLDDLREVASRGKPWILGYGVPDEWALSGAADLSADLRKAIDTATDEAVKRHGLEGRRAVWLTAGGVSGTVLDQTRPGDSVLIAGSDLTGWQHVNGSAIRKPVEGDELTVAVVDDVLSDLPEPLTGATVRQAILAETTFAALSRHADPASRDSALVVIPPGWDPGSDTGAVADAVSVTFADGQSLEALVTAPKATVDTPVAPATAQALDPAVLTEAADLSALSADVLELAGGNPVLAGALAQDVALLTSISWRDNAGGALAVASARERALDRQLGRLTIEGPPSFTLSGTEGRFPLTISNDTDFDVTVGVKLESSNPALTIPDVEPVTIPADGRHTLTVTVDVGRQKSSSVTATLVAGNGDEYGEAAQFNLRSSNVDSVIWIVMATSLLVVVLALARRVLRRRKETASDE